MWSSQAGRIVACLVAGTALAGCGEQRLDVCKAARGGDAPHSVELAESTFTKPARPLPVVTIAADGIYFDARPLLASLPRDRCEKLVRKIAPRDRSSLAEEQFILGLRNFAPASAEAERLGMMRLEKAIWGKKEVLHARGFNLRVDKRAPSGLVQRVWVGGGLRYVHEVRFVVADREREASLARGWAPPPDPQAFPDSCAGLGQVVEVQKQGLSIAECDWPIGPLDSCECALSATTSVPDRILRRILDVPIPAACSPMAPEVMVGASANVRWSRWVAMYTRLHRIKIPTALSWEPLPKRDCGILLTPSGPILPSTPAVVPPWCSFIGASPLEPPDLTCPSTGFRFQYRVDEIGRLLTR